MGFRETRSSGVAELMLTCARSAMGLKATRRNVLTWFVRIGARIEEGLRLTDVGRNDKLTLTSAGL